jgi:hypothetical protein
VTTIPPYSSRTPSAPGYYWLRADDIEDIVEVWNDPGHPSPETVFFIHRCGSGECEEIGSLGDAEWAGPIPTPRS